jgi:hypothetical protein
MLREPLPKLDSDLDADGRRCDDHTEWPAGLGCTGLAFDQLELDRRARVGRSERIALLAPASRNQQYTVGVAA